MARSYTSTAAAPRVRAVLLVLALAASPACAFSLVSAAANLASAGVAGALGAVCVYPLDLVKTRLQASTGGCYKNGVDAAVQLFTKEGPASLFKGIGPQVIGVVPEKTIKLFIHDSTVLLIGEPLSGALAGLCQVVVTNPLEIVKVRLQLADGRRTIRDVVDEIGFAGLYTGAVACAARDSSFSAILFPTYAFAKSALEPLLAPELTTVAGHTDGSAAALLLCFVAGVLGAAPAAFFTTPFDVVKTRLQEGCELPAVDECEIEPIDMPYLETCEVPLAASSADGLGEMAASVALKEPPREVQSVKFTTRSPAGGSGTAAKAAAAADDARPAVAADGSVALETAAAVVREEGFLALFSGGSERVLRSAPQFGVTLATYEFIRAHCVAAGWI